MFKPHKKVYCRCTKNCARCTVANNPVLPMHPEMYAAYQKKNSIKTNSPATARGLTEKINERRGKENVGTDSSGT
jgi:hypothetical protein